MTKSDIVKKQHTPPPTIADTARALANATFVWGGDVPPLQRLWQPVKPGLLSIVTPTFNAASTLPRTLAAVAALQGDVEHIVVDGGSSDNTVEFLKQAPRVTCWISGRDAGISDAFNRGIALAHGEYILIINADDWVSPEAVMQRVACLRDNVSASFVFSDLDLYDGDQYLYRIQGDAQYENTIAHRMPALNHPTVMVRRSVYEDVGLFRQDFKVAMDYEWLLRAHRAGHTGLHVPNAAGCMARAGVSDQQFFRGLAEVRKASVMHGYAAIPAWSRYGFRLLKGGVRQRMERILPACVALRLRRLVNRDLRAQ